MKNGGLAEVSALAPARAHTHTNTQHIVVGFSLIVFGLFMSVLYRLCECDLQAEAPLSASGSSVRGQYYHMLHHGDRKDKTSALSQRRSLNAAVSSMRAYAS